MILPVEQALPSPNLSRGGNVLVMFGPKWRLHSFAHLDSTRARPGNRVGAGTEIATVGDTGNAHGKAAHLHYTVLTLIPHPWRIGGDTQGWKKMFYLDPVDVLRMR